MKKETDINIFKIFILSAPVAVFLFLLILFAASNILFPFNHRREIRKISDEYNIDPLLVASIIFAESKYKNNIVSKAGAVGMMQLMPSTALETAKKHSIPYGGRETLTDTSTNIRLGSAYFSDLLEYYGRDMVKSLAAYNAGKSNVPKWTDENGRLDTGKIDFPETRDYIVKTGFYYKILRGMDRAADLSGK
ncbi:MAG: lytic transglycosylase domain-containing protein [bacterium]|nr:lytic transglycosylase domain-containing protein [bacterium]